jgi:hypothetical protein
MSMEKQVQDMIDILTANKSEAVAGDKGNKTAAKRLRAGIAVIPKMCKALKATTLGKE